MDDTILRKVSYLKYALIKYPITLNFLSLLTAILIIILLDFLACKQLYYIKFM